MSDVFLDPTDERAPGSRALAPRPHEVAGTVGLLDISKPRGNVFLDRLEQGLRGLGLEVLRFRKPTFTKPASADLRRQIAERCDLVVEALAD